MPFGQRDPPGPCCSASACPLAAPFVQKQPPLVHSPGACRPPTDGHEEPVPASIHTDTVAVWCCILIMQHNYMRSTIKARRVCGPLLLQLVTAVDTAIQRASGCCAAAALSALAALAAEPPVMLCCKQTPSPQSPTKGQKLLEHQL